MHLHLFIEQHMSEIMAEWVSFARTLDSATEEMTLLQLRDHAESMLKAIALDIESQQSRGEQYEKSRGNAPNAGISPTAASIHGAQRHQSKFTLANLSAEFRALRATVLRLWLPSVDSLSADTIREMIRFNEAIDQALAESIVTYSARADQALRSSHQELEAFSYSVSHDLRGPISAIGGFCQALEAHLEGHVDDRAKHFIERINAGVAKMEKLIEALLSLSNLAAQQVEWAVIDLSALAGEMLDDLQEQQPERQVTVVVQQGLVAHGDPQLLRIALQNLLANAWKFSSHRTDARIEVGRREEDGALFVRDNGAGFDMAYADKLFVPFQRLHTEADFAGTGIGLTTTRRIVTRHQGRVWAESREGEGATFFIALAAAPPPAGSARDSQGPQH